MRWQRKPGAAPGGAAADAPQPREENF